MATPKTIYLRAQSGATRALAGRRLAKLVREVRAGRGGPEITALAEAGYTAFLGPDGEDWDLDAIATYLTKETP